jgi:hypothetical protein
MNNLIKGVLTLALLALLIFIYSASNNPNNTNTDNTSVKGIMYEDITVTVVIPGKEEETMVSKSVEGLTLEEVLDRLMLNGSLRYAKQSASFGSYITSVQGVTADAQSEFWNIKINGLDAQAGISEINPQDDDVITLTLMKF